MMTITRGSQCRDSWQKLSDVILRLGVHVNTIAAKLRIEWKNRFEHLTRVGHIPKKLHEGHLGVIFNPQKEIVITSGL